MRPAFSRRRSRRTGLSLQGGLDAITAAEQLANTLTEHPSLLDPATWPALRDTVLTAATTIQELHRSATAKDRPIGAVAPLAGDWIAGWTLQEIHSHYQLLLDAKDITATSDYIDKVIVQDLAWAVSSILQILETRHGITPDGPLATLPAMLKYGVDTTPACYAASLGIHQRSAAIDLAARCPVPEPSFSDFTGWLGDLTTDEITAITTPSIAALLIRSTERRSPRTVQKTILSGRGTFTTPLRGIRHTYSDGYLADLAAGTVLDLVRDHDNPSDPNAIRVEHNGLRLGWVATAVLHTDPRSFADTGQLAGHDQVELTITISPAPEGRGARTSR